MAIDFGSGNTVANMRLVDNRGDFESDFGDGVALFSSNNDVVKGNQIRNNGPYDGIGLITSDGNVIAGNQIIDNNQSPTNTAGIRLENNFNAGTASDDNTVSGNFVSGSGDFGIQVFANGSDNQIRSNQVLANRLDGITVFAGGARNTIEANNVGRNGANGIFLRGRAGAIPVGAHDNQVLRNSSSGNGQFDLRDGNANCDNNVWSANRGRTGTPACVFNP